MKYLGANEAALRRLIETGITVEAVSEDLYCVESAEMGPSVWADLAARGFDRCGISNGGQVIGYVESATTENHSIQPIQIHQLVAETTPLWQAMPRLAESLWLFVLTPSGPTGIVTLADLAKQPARLLMFGVLSLLEMAMLAIIRREFPDTDWCDLLSNGRIEKASTLLAQRREKGQDIDLADCLQWCDKAAICAKSEQIRTRWDLPGKGQCDRLFEEIQVLRDQLAHSQHPAPDGDWRRVVKCLQEADRLITVSVDMLGVRREVKE